jgi:hypothetical protein
MMADYPIPEDLAQEWYHSKHASLEHSFSNLFVQKLIERIAVLSKPVSDEELAYYSASGSRGLMLVGSRDVTELIRKRFPVKLERNS